MSLVTVATNMIERVPVPDVVTSAGIAFLVGQRRRQIAGGRVISEPAFAELMARQPIAVRPDAANAQHYEVAPAFFGLVLGPRRKYSCCLYRSSGDTLAQAEEFALEETAAHADLADGQDILELGCGWGSLSLWMAARYPAARIVSVSNSRPQREYIEGQARALGMSNLRVITADMNDFAAPGIYDRIVSVEMFEHMSNWQSLLGRIHGWLRPDGLLFLHVFSHRSAPYLFDTADKEDWIAQHFFTGGIMPSHGLIRHVAERFEVVGDWRWNGEHYAKTARHWLANMDREAEAVAGVLRGVYGDEAALWTRRWRLFFLATAGLFGHAGGEEWGVSHYRLRPLAP